MRLAKKWTLPFSVLLGLLLAITVPLLLAIWTNDSSTDRHIAVVVVIAAAFAAVGSILGLFAYQLASVGIPVLLHRLMVWVTFRTVHRAIAQIDLDVDPTGIDSIQGDIRIGLPLGLQDGLAIGERFVVLNAASQDKWGELEVAEIEETSCACSVYNRTNSAFWDSLENRMQYDASPPQGVTIRREMPEEFLLDWLTRLLQTTRG